MPSRGDGQPFMLPFILLFIGGGLFIKGPFIGGQSRSGARACRCHCTDWIDAAVVDFLAHNSTVGDRDCIFADRGEYLKK